MTNANNVKKKERIQPIIYQLLKIHLEFFVNKLKKKYIFKLFVQ